MALPWRMWAEPVTGKTQQSGRNAEAAVKEQEQLSSWPATGKSSQAGPAARPPRSQAVCFKRMAGAGGGGVGGARL